MRRLTVFVRSGCHLCEEMLAELAGLRAKRAFELEVVDILGRPGLEQEYGTRIPVLKAGETEICYYFLDRDALARYFDNA